MGQSVIMPLLWTALAQAEPAVQAAALSPHLGWDGWFTLGMVVVMLFLMVRGRISPDLVAIGVLTILVTVLIALPHVPGMGAWQTSFTTTDALSGFSNEGMITVAVLFIVAAALKETGGMSFLATRILGRPASILGAQIRLMLPIAAMSAFMNNTPLVAMMLPVVDDWCKKTRLSPSKLFIPLSFATILGGTCTLIGTSPNLIVNGLMQNSQHDSLSRGMSMFELAWVGAPRAIIGMIYILALSRWLLPDRKAGQPLKEDPRQYTIEMTVEPGSGLVGKSIEEAGLRHLPGMYLIEIEREGGEVLPAVTPQERLRGNDRLVFTGIIESVVDLQKIRGLKPATSQVFKLDSPRSRRTLVEAVVSKNCPLVGKTIRDGEFRKVYNAVVIAVGRQGERVKGKIGDIELEAGDTLLLEAHPSFVDQQKNSRDFYLVSRVEDSAPPRHERAWWAIGLLALMVAVVSAGLINMFTASLLAAMTMVLTRCVSWSTAKRALDLTVILIIAATFGVGLALERTGAARFIAEEILRLTGDNPLMALASIYLVTMVFTELITNAAAVALVFPIALATADSLGVDARPFAIAITLAGSSSFSTPIGYQTNLMVMGPGGYRFTDYTRFGLPLSLIQWGLSVWLIPKCWSF